MTDSIIEKLKKRVSRLEFFRKNNTKGFKCHGTDAYATRPNFKSVEWIGSVEPINAIDNDTWVDTSA